MKILLWRFLLIRELRFDREEANAETNGRVKVSKASLIRSLPGSSAHWSRVLYSALSKPVVRPIARRLFGLI